MNKADMLFALLKAMLTEMSKGALISDIPQLIAAWSRLWDEYKAIDFLALPFPISEAEGDVGQLKTTRSPSALMMSRVKQAYPWYVELDEQAQEQWLAMAGPGHPWSVMAGRANRPQKAKLIRTRRHLSVNHADSNG